MIAERDKNDCDSHKKAIERIKQKHKNKKQFHRIKNALKRLKKSSLKRLEVPVEDEQGWTTRWDVLCTKSAIHDRIIHRNHKHMDQESATPFGDGKGYEALHGSARQEVMDKIHAGDLVWDDPVEEVNKWIEELKAAYDQHKLDEEVKS